MLFRQIFEPRLAQYAYLVGCQQTREALLVDPQRDVDRYLALAKSEGLKIVAATETHIHADFLSGVRELTSRGVKAYLSAEGGEDWQYRWTSGDGYDVELLRGGDRFSVGDIDFTVRHTPGHTPEHLSFELTDRGAGADEPMGLLSGDFVFVGDLGRPDLLESAAGEIGAMRPAAETLFRSVKSFLELPDFLQVWPGHGAGSACGKALGAVPESTVGYERRFNAAILAAKVSQDSFVDMMLDGQPEPPLYFGRMKQWNRQGPPLLAALPQPAQLSIDELARLNDQGDVVILDTRLDRRGFMTGHLSKSIYAPLNKSFPTIAGSYVEPGRPIYLLSDADRVQEAVRALVRIGLDEVVGFAAPGGLDAYLEAGGELSTIDIVDFAALSGRDTQILDVRRRAEYDAGHLEGALNVAHTRLVDRQGELPKGRELAVHCQTGARAASAASLLVAAGFRVAYVDDDVASHI
jgi:hydroxyacylglutathione hydrolase